MLAKLRSLLSKFGSKATLTWLYYASNPTNNG